MFSADNLLETFRANLWVALAVNVPLALAACIAGAVRLSGFIVGLIYGVLILATGGWPAFLVLGLFFLLGSLVSRVGLGKKKDMGVSHDKEEARGGGSVAGNCTVGLLLLVLIAAAGDGRGETVPPVSLLLIAYVGSFAAALADTFASELGPLYGKLATDPLTLEAVPHGTPGAVSVSGTILGLAGAMAMALLGVALGLMSKKAMIYVMFTSLVAMLLESYVRSRRPGRGLIHKQLPNLFVSFSGALGSFLLALVFGH